MNQTEPTAHVEIRVGFVANSERIDQWQCDALLELKNRFKAVKLVQIRISREETKRIRTKLRPPFRKSPQLRRVAIVADQLIHIGGDGTDSQQSNRESEQALVDARLDFLLCFSHDDFEWLLPLSETTRWGLWFIDLGSTPYAWRSYNRAGNTHGASFVGAVPNRQPLALFRDSLVAVRKYSYRETVKHLLGIASQWPAEVVATFLKKPDYGWACIEKDVVSQPQPSIADDLRYVFQFPLRKTLHIWRTFTKHDYWHIGVVDHPIQEFLSNPNVLDQVSWIPLPSPDRMYADPFVYFDSGGAQLIFEDYDRVKGVARISAMPLDSNESAQPEPAFVSDHHLSYPYTFKVEDEWYCIPESAGDNHVSLHKFNQSSSRWELDTVLLTNFSGVDTSVIQHQGRWWLFTGCKDDKPDLKLFVFYADSFRGPWHSHTANPVKTDNSNSRCGGTFFHHESRLYRPTQDSKKTYGQRIVINEIVRLSPNEFEEQVVVTVEPRKNWPFPNGLHTLSQAGDQTIIDAKRFELDWWESARRIREIASRVSNKFAKRSTFG